MSRQTRLLLFAAASIIGLALGYLGIRLFPQPYTFRGSLIEPPIPATDFTLQNYDGRPFTLSEQRGKVVLLFFGYTNCPDVCPTTLSDYRRIASQLGERAEEVVFVMVTADRERDTPEQLGTYVTAFGPEFYGLTGSKAELQAVYDGYGVFVEKEEPDSTLGYLVSHTSRVYVIDQGGSLRLTFPFGLDVQAMADDIAHLVSSGDS